MAYEIPELVLVGPAEELVLSGTCGCGDCSCSTHGHGDEVALDYEE